MCSGLAKRAHLVMSHETGKIEVLGLTEEQIFFKYIRAVDSEDSSKLLAFGRNPDAFWYDDYEEAEEEFSLFDLATVDENQSVY